MPGGAMTVMWLQMLSKSVVTAHSANKNTCGQGCLIHTVPDDAFCSALHQAQAIEPNKPKT